jgi:hypothetical protein
MALFISILKPTTNLKTFYEGLNNKNHTHPENLSVLKIIIQQMFINVKGFFQHIEIKWHPEIIKCFKWSTILFDFSNMVSNIIQGCNFVH